MNAAFDEVLEAVRAEVDERQARVPLETLKSWALVQPSAKAGTQALRVEGIAIIAEVHPGDLPKSALADEYEQAGASAVSVTARSSRAAGPAGATAQGSLGDLKDVRGRVQIPVLYRDLVLSSYQLWEARAYGADLVQLTAAALEQQALVSLIERAASIGLSALVEVHDEMDVVRAVSAGSKIIVVSADNPVTHEVDRDAAAALLALIPQQVVRVAECGLAGRADLVACARAGADAVLIGQSLLAGNDPRRTVAGLVAAGAHPALWRGRRQAV